MEKIGFIGGYHKTDLIIYIAKILTKLGNKVLILDTTKMQKTRYVVPAINPTISYITEFHDIDVAVGFQSFREIQGYLGEEDEELAYDYALIDIDSINGIKTTGLDITDKIFFVTGFDLYSLKKGVEILTELENPLKLTKVYFSRTFYSEDDEYLEFLALGKKVVWDSKIIYFPLENGDETAIAENKKLEKIKFKNLSPEYREGIAVLVNDIETEKGREIKNLIKNMIKNIE